MKQRAEWLWWGLAVVWSLLLLQAILPPDDEPHRSWVLGGIIWLVGLVALVGLGVRSRRQRR